MKTVHDYIEMFWDSYTYSGDYTTASLAIYTSTTTTIADTYACWNVSSFKKISAKILKKIAILWKWKSPIWSIVSILTKFYLFSTV